MSRPEDLSDGRLIELLTRHFLEDDPMPEVAVAPLVLLAEVARRIGAAESDQEHVTDELHAQRWPTATARRHRNKLRREAERHHTGPEQ